MERDAPVSPIGIEHYMYCSPCNSRNTTSPCSHEGTTLLHVYNYLFVVSKVKCTNKYDLQFLSHVVVWYTCNIHFAWLKVIEFRPVLMSLLRI